MKKLWADIFKFLPALALAAIVFCAGNVYAVCAGPAGNEGDIVYNSSNHLYQFCNGSIWLAYSGGTGNCTAAGGYSPATPPDSGYFVVTKSTYNGNLGGIIAANSTCLTELTTNTGWKGYSTANANGQLIADKVHALLQNSAYTNMLTPLATYKFANANDATAGGASFTADSYGNGPGDSADWSGSTYFNATLTYWVGNIDTANNTYWDVGNDPYAQNTCNDFTTNSSGQTGLVGVSNNTNIYRWSTWPTSPTCDNTYHLICFVNP